MTTHDHDPHKVLHVYEGDGGVIVWENGNVSTFGVQSPEVMAAFYAASALLPEDAAEIVGGLQTLKAAFAAEGDNFGMEVSEAFHNAASLIQSLEAGWAADKARIAGLEADAARYRWLRNQPEGLSNRWPHVTQYPHQPEIDEFKPPQITREWRRKGEYLDEAIDAALSATREQLLSRHARSLLNGERKG